ncbi:sialidase family protein [Actinomadura sp. WMMB 499]|uniref:sialidase family protein n=1 Tax=Actinomadura sp. WMMB 499 TaxID=1219491 RepID=UPI00124589C1|nr:sialidase family protein [Actinomadura sp. WMMB 499]QFG20758.1 exo-alpha-sialidase [Actinomadura sp. WMMB 499]
MRPSQFVLPALLVPLLALSGTAAAAVHGPGRLSGPSPFAGCAPGAIDGKMAAGAIEPAVAADPSDPRRLAAVWPQDRNRGAVVAVTGDGGRHWKRSVVPGLTRCSGGRYDHVDDPMVTFTRDGGLVVTGSVFTDDYSESAALSVRSGDGGRTWTRPAVVAGESDPAQGGVHGSGAVPDPRDPDVLHMAGARFPAEARTNNEGWIARSTDGGRTWEEPRTTVASAEGSMVTGHRLVALDDGTLLDFHTHVRFGGGPGLSDYSVQVVRSTDGGATWSRPSKVGDMGTTIAIRDPESGEDVSHTTSILSDVAVDRRTGRLYAVWQDARFTGGAADGVALASSADGGRTWSEPVKANRTPATVPVPNQQAFTVSVEVGRGGTVAVSYSDFRANDAAAPLRTDRWLATCRPAPAASCADGTARWRETRLTAASFDMRRAPRIPDEASPRGYFLGEQMGLAAAGGGFVSVWAEPDAPGRAAAFVRTTR